MCHSPLARMAPYDAPAGGAGATLAAYATWLGHPSAGQDEGGQTSASSRSSSARPGRSGGSTVRPVRT
jgi:hypothetical protein